MHLSRRTIIVLGATLAVAVGGAGAAFAVSGDETDADEQVTGPAADRAREAALARYAGQVTSVERESEDASAWEVEIRRSDGREVEVELNREYRIVETEVDDDDEREDDD